MLYAVGLPEPTRVLLQDASLRATRCLLDASLITNAGFDRTRQTMERLFDDAVCPIIRTLLAERRDWIARANMQLPPEKMICPACGERKCRRDREASDHPGAFICTACNEQFLA